MQKWKSRKIWMGKCKWKWKVEGPREERAGRRGGLSRLTDRLGLSGQDYALIGKAQSGDQARLSVL
jgi:hypothetical protein